MAPKSLAPKSASGTDLFAGTPPVVIFDGVCHLCARSVRFILHCEAAPTLRFVPLQSPAGVRLLKAHGFDPEDARTFVLLINDTVIVKSDAAIRIAEEFRWPWKALQALSILPLPLRDWIYDRVAQNRYRWFGRSATCMVPTPALRHRFIEDDTQSV